MFIFFSLLGEEEKTLITKLYYKLNQYMYKMAMKILKNNDDAEEAVSNTFVKIMKNIERISKIPCPEMEYYCVTILRNECFNILREKEKYVLSKDVENSEEDIDFEKEIIKRFEIDTIRQYVDNLPYEEKLLIQFRYVNEMSFKEIGVLFGISEDAANKRAQRIIKKLIKMYEEGEKSER